MKNFLPLKLVLTGADVSVDLKYYLLKEKSGYINKKDLEEV